jgi:hypothetical protein
MKKTTIVTGNVIANRFRGFFCRRQLLSFIAERAAQLAASIFA